MADSSNGRWSVKLESGSQLLSLKTENLTLTVLCPFAARRVLSPNGANDFHRTPDWTPDHIASRASRHYRIGRAKELKELTAYLATVSPRLESMLAGSSDNSLVGVDIRLEAARQFAIDDSDTQAADWSSDSENDACIRSLTAEAVPREWPAYKYFTSISREVDQDRRLRRKKERQERRERTVCAGCGQTASELGIARLKKCQACTLMPQYCSEACQRRMWPSHKTECRANRRAE